MGEVVSTRNIEVRGQLMRGAGRKSGGGKFSAFIRAARNICLSKEFLF